MSAQAATGAVLAVAECIRDLGAVPSGHLYARLMGHMSADAYQGVIAALVRAGLVRQHPNHLLEWIGPSGPSAKHQQPKGNQVMNNTVTIPANANAKAILETNKPPRGSTHFRYTEGKRKPVIDKLANIDTLAGCTGKLEFGKVTFEGRGKHSKVKDFTPLADDVPAPATPAAPGPAKPSPTGTARKNKIHGFSACAVAKALGAAGIKWEEADKIMRAHGIEMPKASLSVQLGFGRNRETWEKRGEPAGLTPEQIADLRKGVGV